MPELANNRRAKVAAGQFGLETEAMDRPEIQSCGKASQLRMAMKLQDARTAKIRMIREFELQMGFISHPFPSISIYFSSFVPPSFQVLEGPLAFCQRWHRCHHLQLPSPVAVWLCVLMQWLDTNPSDEIRWNPPIIWSFYELLSVNIVNDDPIWIHGWSSDSPTNCKTLDYCKAYPIWQWLF